MIIFLFADFEIGGSQKIAVEIFNELIKKKSDMIALSTSNKGDLKKKIKKKNIYCLGYNRLIVSIFKLYKFLKDKKPTQIFCTQPHLGIIIFFLNFFLSKKVKIIVRETNTSKFNNFFDISFKKRCENLFKLIIFNFVSIVVFPSKNISYKLNTRSVIIPNFVDLQEIKHAKKTNIKNFILGMGRLSKQKGFNTLIKAFINIKNKINHNLLIVGEGEEYSHLMRIIKENKVQNRVKILNFTDKPYSYIKGCSLFVLSSRWEGMPNILIQALASKANILSTDCMFGPKEILKNGKLGHLCKIGNVNEMSKKILFSLKHKKKISFIDYSQYDKKIIIKKYLKLFN